MRPENLRRNVARLYSWSMIFPENRYPLFGIMLYSAGFAPAAAGCAAALRSTIFTDQMAPS
jgi:hypothetical protein